ncbi:TPA: MFS transporter, partial [Streptococcus pyogenes]
SAYNLITPYMSQYYDGKMNNFYGISLMVQAIGSVVFSYLNKKYLSDKSWAKTEYFLILVGVFITCIGGIDYLFHNPIASLIPFFFVGGMLTVFNIRFFTTVQIEVEDEYIGRVYSVIFTIAVVFMPIGSLFFGKFMGVETLSLLIISGIGIVVTGIIYIFTKNKRRRI